MPSSDPPEQTQRMTLVVQAHARAGPGPPTEPSARARRRSSPSAVLEVPREPAQEPVHPHQPAREPASPHGPLRGGRPVRPNLGPVKRHPHPVLLRDPERSHRCGRGRRPRAGRRRTPAPAPRRSRRDGQSSTRPAPAARGPRQTGFPDDRPPTGPRTQPATRVGRAPRGPARAATGHSHPPLPVARAIVLPGSVAEVRRRPGRSGGDHDALPARVDPNDPDQAAAVDRSALGRRDRCSHTLRTHHDEPLPAERDGHVPVHGHRGLDPAGAQSGTGMAHRARDPQPHPARRHPDRRRRRRQDRRRRRLRGLRARAGRGGRRRAGSAEPRRPHVAGAPSASGWGFTRARGSGVATTTSGSTSTGRRGSPPRPTVDRSCSRTPPWASSSTPCRTRSWSGISAATD